MFTPVLSLIAVAVIANLAVMAVIVVPPMFGRPSPLAREDDPDLTPERRAAEAAVIGTADLDDDAGALVQTYDRVVRVVAWSFIVTAGLIVAISGLWPDTQAAILLILRLLGRRIPRRSRSASRGGARTGQVRHRRFGRDHGRDAARDPDRTASTAPSSSRSR